MYRSLSDNCCVRGVWICDKQSSYDNLAYYNHPCVYSHVDFLEKYQQIIQTIYSMRIIGIDPGSGIIGFGLVEQGGTSKMLDAGVIRTTVGDEAASRLVELYESMKELLAEMRPDAAAVEKLFFAQNVTTAMNVSQARGVILLALAEAGLPIYEYTPLQIKMAMTGYGRATKAQVQEMVRVQLGLKTKPKPDDCADALACALTHIATLRVQ